MLRNACKLLEGRKWISLNMFLTIPLPVFVLCMKQTLIFLFERKKGVWEVADREGIFFFFF